MEGSVRAPWATKKGERRKHLRVVFWDFDCSKKKYTSPRKKRILLRVKISSIRVIIKWWCLFWFAFWVPSRCWLSIRFGELSTFASLTWPSESSFLKINFSEYFVEPLYHMRVNQTCPLRTFCGMEDSSLGIISGYFKFVNLLFTIFYDFSRFFTIFHDLSSLFNYFCAVF